MSPQQLQVFWDHFKVLEPNLIQYEKPPSNWKPPQFKDMDENQLETYWNAFRKCMTPALHQSPADLSADKQIVPVDSSAKSVGIRARGKTSPQELVARLSELTKKKAVAGKSSKSKPVSQKRKYVQKAKVSRDGKRPSVTIWAKVQLFKEA